MEDVTDALKDLTIEQVPVYLLKTKSSPTDAYEEHISSLEDGKYRPIFVPVLDHIFRDDALRTLRRSAERFAFASGSEASGLRKATHNPAKKYGGLVFTSQRAVDAFATVIAKLDPKKLHALFDKDMPLYVVGPATANGVRALGLPCPVIGEQTGSGEALAAYIQAWHATLPQEVTHLDDHKLPLLFMVGEQRRDIIPNTLQSEELQHHQRIQVVELIVYETGELAAFEETFTSLARAAKRQRVKEQCVIVFSPQGCEAMLNALGWLDSKSGLFNAGLREVMSGPMRTTVTTIGPTTKEFLVQEFQFEPDAVAVTPTPEAVGEAIGGSGGD